MLRTRGLISNISDISQATAAGPDTAIQFNNSGALDGSENATVDLFGNAYFAGDLSYKGTLSDISDARLKKDVAPLDPPSILDRLMQVKTYSFRYKTDAANRLQFGVIAQEVEKQFPNLVVTAKDAMGTKSVNYIGFIAPLIEANKSLKAEIEVLRREIQEMKCLTSKASRFQFRPKLIRKS